MIEGEVGVVVPTRPWWSAVCAATARSAAEIELRQLACVGWLRAPGAAARALPYAACSTAAAARRRPRQQRAAPPAGREARRRGAGGFFCQRRRPQRR